MDSSFGVFVHTDLVCKASEFFFLVSMLGEMMERAIASSSFSVHTPWSLLRALRTFRFSRDFCLPTLTRASLRADWLEETCLPIFSPFIYLSSFPTTAVYLPTCLPMVYFLVISYSCCWNELISFVDFPFTIYGFRNNNWNRIQCFKLIELLFGSDRHISTRLHCSFFLLFYFISKGEFAGSR